MNRTRRMTAALLIAVSMSLALSSARLEAKGGGGNSICSALLSIMNNTSLSQAVRDAARYTYNALGCQ
jgi:hypothetical protein